jgi:hypothetical protein
MKAYIKRILLFGLIAILLGEIIVRVFHLSVDVPKVYRDEDNLVKFVPNQTGYSAQGYKWIINKYGNYGHEPQSLDSLVTIIGNSFISATMNPPECHQSNYLAGINQDFNFYPMSRDGASFLEFLEMAKSLEKLNPVKQLFYVHESDFIVSTVERFPDPLTIQLSLEKQEIIFTKPSNNSWKKKLYHFKFAYFLYRNFVVPVMVDLHLVGGRVEESLFEVHDTDYPYLQGLMDYVKDHYSYENIVLVFFPESDERLIRMTEEAGFTVLRLRADDYRSWVEHVGGHWNCHGHKEVALQVDSYLADLSL